MSKITLGEGSTISINGMQFPLKAGITLNVELGTKALLDALALSDEQQRLLQLGASLFGTAPARAAAPERSNGRRARSTPSTQDPWSGEKVYSPGFGHFSDVTRTLTGIEKDRAKAKALGDALRSARANNAGGVAKIVEQYTGRFKKADEGEKKKLLVEVIRELRSL